MPKINKIKPSYKQSVKYLERSRKVISGASTFSKLNHFGEGKTPFALTDGKGAYVWDVDGNKYIDYVSCRGYLILGYNYPYVTRAITKQLKDGVAYSLPHTLEIEVAEMLRERIPSAEMVRFGKNGNDATSAAIRLARHITKRDHFLFWGYHGWQDWYSSQTSMNGGVPKSLKNLGHRFVYNDIESVERLFNGLKGDVAAVIMEPTRFERPEKGFLENVKKLAHDNGALLIFDEIITGFRLQKKGAQKLFNVIPDITCLGKAMGNGMPISAVVGKKEYMKRFPEVFYSLTSAGEALSLAAAKATMEVFDKIDVCGHLDKIGKELMDELIVLIDKYGLSDRMKVRGYSCYSNFYFVEDKNSKLSPTGLMDFWTQEIAKRGILSCECHIMNLSHTKQTNKETLKVYDEVLPLVKDLIEKS
ncbi:MAG: aminotransferase class III-fold pyridoxal phosphate-dependent enzyme [bacterium]